MAAVNSALLAGFGATTFTAPRNCDALLSVRRNSTTRTTSVRETQLKPCLPLPITPPTPREKIGSNLASRPAREERMGAKRRSTVRMPSFLSACNASASHCSETSARKPVSVILKENNAV